MTMMAPVATEASTRERLLAVGMTLFSQQGFRATTVGEIEAAAGLQPRRGALYKHFPSKQALLDAAVDRHLAAIGTAAAQVGSIDTTRLAASDAEQFRAFLVAIGRWFLGELDDQRALTHLLEHDGARLSATTHVVREQIVDLGYGAVADLIASASSTEVDAEGLSVVLLGSLAAARRTAWTFGATPLELDDERLLAAWAETCLAIWSQLVGAGVQAFRPE